MAAAVDVAYLSTHLGVAPDTLSAVAAAPTAELVQVVLEAVTTKAREYDNLYAQKLHADIELESSVRGSESRVESFKATADKALKDVEALRIKLHEEGELCLHLSFSSFCGNRVVLVCDTGVDPVVLVSNLI